MNTGTVNAVDPTGRPVTATDPAHYFGVQGGIDIEKFTTARMPTNRPGRSSRSAAR